MSFYTNQYDPEVVNMWLHNAALTSSDTDDEYLVNMAATMPCPYSTQSQNFENHLAPGAPAQSSCLSQGNLSFTNGWQGNNFAPPIFSKPAYQQAFFHPEQFQNAYSAPASAPPSVFTKFPSAIDHYHSDPVAPLDWVNVGPCHPTNPVLPPADTPGLDHDSTSPVETSQNSSNWPASDSSPIMKVESNSSQSGEHQTVESTEVADPCYAELLRQALMEAEDRNYTMQLKEIYEWVRTHSTKAQDPNNKGWQNSVRHNLSMNAAFERVTDQEGSTKKTSYWRLTKDAIQRGISSTTRYRKDTKRKTQRNPNPAPLRVQSGAKGGNATRRSTRRHHVTAPSPMESLSSSSASLRQDDYPALGRSIKAHKDGLVVAQSQFYQQQRRMSEAQNSIAYDTSSDMFDQSMLTPTSLDNNTQFEESKQHSYLAPSFGYNDWSLSAVSPKSQAHAGHEMIWLHTTARRQNGRMSLSPDSVF